MSWMYHGEEFTEPGNYVGFRKYIGKKLFWTPKRKQVNKKRVRFKVESDWKEYWSSSDELKADVEKLGKDNFTREILHLCLSKGATNYLEAKEQFVRGVLENSELWYNTWIMVRVNRSHLKKL